MFRKQSVKRFYKIVLIMAVLLIIASIGIYYLAPHPPHVPDKINDVREVNAFFERLVKSGNPPGLSAAVVKDGQLVYNRAFGYADGPRRIKASPETVYHWWSITKIPTAAAILQLREQGRLDLDDPVKRHLPWFNVIYPTNSSPDITIRHLLQHSSGLADTMPYMIAWVHDDDSPRDQTRLVQTHLPEFNKLLFIPGTDVSYSNLNYMVLGAVIESASGQTYEKYIMMHILKPLHMSQTGFVYTSSMAGNEALGTLPVIHYYTLLIPMFINSKKFISERIGRLIWFKRIYIDATPSTGLLGPAHDVARFMMMILNGGELEDKVILSPQSVSLLMETKPIRNHGLGWFVGEAGGNRYLEHAGGGPGFATIMRVYPDKRLGIAVLANGTDLDRSGIAGMLAKFNWGNIQ